ncbi:MAG: 30S ribosomal protein S5 [Patescibacteria group bacterium]
MAKDKRQPKQQGEYQQKLLDLRRVARVVAGGRRFSFRATVVVGNLNGEVGIGIGKGSDTALAIEKAARKARQSLIKVPLTKERSIPHEVEAKYASGHVIIKPAKNGKGLVAGGAARVVLAFAGVSNASAKILSHTKNKINNGRATIDALKTLKTKKN